VKGPTKVVYSRFMEKLDEGHLHPSIKHPDMSRPGIEPPTNCTERALYQRAITTAYSIAI
jgi:hypothetical protein